MGVQKVSPTPVVITPERFVHMIWGMGIHRTRDEIKRALKEAEGKHYVAAVALRLPDKALKQLRVML